MEGTHRGRSPSAGRHTNNHLNHAGSQQFQDHANGLDIDPSLISAAFTPGTFSSDMAPNNGSELQYSYIDGSAQQQQYDPQSLSTNRFSGQVLNQAFHPNGMMTDLPQGPSTLDGQQSNHQFNPELLGTNPSNAFGDFPHQDLPGKQGQQQFDNGFLIDPDLQGGMQQPQHQSINPADIMSNMSSPQNLIPTPPNLMPPESTSPRGGSPAPRSTQCYSPNHSRHTSLDPSSAIFSHGQQPSDWSNMLQQSQFQTHRRAPSEHSEVSSSVAPSPFLPQDGFEAFDQNPSPLLNAQPDHQLYQDALGIEQFSLSDPQQQGLSPGHSPFVSPRMSPQPGLGLPQDNNFILSQDLHGNFNGGPGPEIYTGPSDTFSQFGARHGSGDLGQAAQMAPPEINVEFAPAVRPPIFEPSRPENDLDALSPPERGQARPQSSLHHPASLTPNPGRRGRRMRAKSDPYISRPVTPVLTPPPTSSDSYHHRNRSLSPFDTFDTSVVSPNQSREPSPSRSSRRSSTSAIPNRDYILELADPSRPAASGTDKRVQKHPATFQCTLCPKRFTRAYNLRSHLRTHTDERPFVCTVCGKAFARQHDRKRHEGLHSGEKKFVCKGELATGGSWGCNRRFARADALGRHFRSEAGRVCIKPLLDEEALERRRVMEEQVMGQNMQVATAPGTSSSSLNPGGVDLNSGAGGFTLPAALLAQYPALQGLQWDQLGAAGQGDDGDYSGRSNYDNSSQGEYFDDDDGGYGSGGTGGGGGGGGGDGNGMGGGGWGEGRADWASDFEGR